MAGWFGTELLTDMAEIRAFEERGFNAWPARQTVLFGGWVLRLSEGHTKRANSANALCPVASFEEVRAFSEALYARHNLPTIFRLSPLAAPEIDQALGDAGYSVADPSFVLVAPLSDAPSDGDVRIEDTPSEIWLEGFAAANGIEAARRAIHDRMVSSIALPAAFATLFENGEAIGFGLAVHERQAIGLFDIIIAPAKRGRGYGRRLTHALLHWGRQIGAQNAYLQVRGENEGARKLYARLRFQELYRYHYRILNSAVTAAPPKAGMACR